MRIRLVPQNTTFAFIRLRKMAFSFSLIMAVASIALFFSQGLNYGIDFRGGTMIEAGFSAPADLNAIRATVGGLDLGDVAVQEFGDPTDVLIRIEQQSGGDEVQQNVVDTVKSALSAQWPDISYRRVEVVGPKVSGELIQTGAMAVGFAVIAMLIYIWFRFEWQFSVGAVIALVHDVVLTIGMFAITGLEFNLSIIAAILTIVGYSMNDTVVVYDRVRENLRKYKKKPLDALLDFSLNETLSRTTMTSLTTLLALGSLYIFGGEVIRGFTAAMIWGVVVGTYSSIFVAAPILLVLGVKRDWSQEGESASQTQS